MNTHVLNLHVNINLKPIVHLFPTHSLRSMHFYLCTCDSDSFLVKTLQNNFLTNTLLNLCPFLNFIYIKLYYMHSYVNMSFI